MRLQSVLAAAAAVPLASAQLHDLAKAAGKLYFGTATDNGELNNTQYVKILTNTSEFGQLTPSNGQKVCHYPLFDSAKQKWNKNSED